MGAVRISAVGNLALTGALAVALTVVAATGPPAAPRLELAASSGSVTAAAFGPIYNYNDVTSGNASNGDTFYNAWGNNDDFLMMHDDGTGFSPGGGNYNAQLTKLSGNPQRSTGDVQGSNLNPGSLGSTLPQTYGAGIIDIGGTLYKMAHYSCQGSCGYNTLTFYNTSMVKSTDGGATWVNAQGQQNTAPPNSLADSSFPANTYGFASFVNYGKGGAAPAVDGAQTYVYMISHDARGACGDNPLQGLYCPDVYLARVARSKIANLNANHADFEYYNNGSWSTTISDARPVLTDAADLHGVQVNYDYALGQYVMSANTEYFPNGSTAAQQYRLGIYTAAHPWGPWTKLLGYAEPHLVAGLLANNKWTSPDGHKMWWLSTGNYNADYYPYGLLYHPVYLSTGTTDRYEAESASRLGSATVATGYDSTYTGTGYVTNFASAGDGSRFAVSTVHGTGWHIVKFRYATTNTGGNTASVWVNGSKVEQLPLPRNDTSYKAAHNWAEVSHVYYLNDGANTIDVKLDTGDAGTGLLLDSATVSEEKTYDEGTNVARSATATVSASAAGYSAAAVNEGVSGQQDTRYEWNSGGGAGNWAQLNWSAPVVLNKVVLSDRPNGSDQVLRGTLTFSDGSSVAVGRLQNDGQAGTVVSFANRSVTSVRFTVDSANGSGVGLSEFQAFTPGRNYVDDDPADDDVRFTGTWGVTTGGAYSGGGVHYASAAGSAVEHSFVGPDVAWIGTKAPDHGKADVYIDGVLDQTVDTYAATAAAPGQLYTKQGLADGSHKIKIVVSAAKNSASTGYYSDVDAFCTGCGTLAPVQSTVNDNGAGVTYSAGWNSGSQAGYFGGDAHWSNTSGAWAQFSFAGTAVSWIAAKDSSHGKVDVYVDGTLDATVDTYSSGQTAPAAVYSRSGLTAGPHVLKVQVRADKNAASSNYYTDVDAFTFVACASACGGASTTVDDSGSGVSYTGAWSSGAQPGYYGGGAHWSNTAGAAVELAFTGTSVTWAGGKDSSHGKVDVLIDGTYDSTVDTYAAGQTAPSAVYSKSGLAAGSHVLRLVLRSDKNPAASNYYTDIDSFTYG